MHTADERTERDYEECLRLLSADGRETTAEVGRWLETFSDDLALRWSLLYLLGDVRDGSSIPLLAEEAKRRLPERMSEPGCEGRIDFEEVVCVMAIEALGRLARDGEQEAVDALLDVIGTQDRKSLRRPAATEVVEAQPALRKRVEELLPENEQYVLDLREATLADLVVTVDDRRPKRKRRKRRAGSRPPRSRG